MRNHQEYTDLLNDRSIKRWYDNLRRGSPVTADVYLRRLGHVCNDLKLTPQRLVEMNESQLYELMLDTVSTMEQRGRGGSYIQSQLKAIKSWLVHDRIEVKGKIKIKGTQEMPTLENERVPTKPELKRILLAGDEKARSACVLIAHGGARVARSLKDRLDFAIRKGEKIPPYFLNASLTRSLQCAQEWLGRNHRITRLLSSGIAVHHGDLPDVLARAVSDLHPFGFGSLEA